MIIALAAVAVLLVLVAALRPAVGKLSFPSWPLGGNPVQNPKPEAAPVASEPEQASGEDIVHTGTLSQQAADAYLASALRAQEAARKAMPENEDRFTKAFLWDLDQDGEQEMLLSYVADLRGIRDDVYAWSYVYGVYDFQNGKQKIWAELEPTKAALVSGCTGYTAVVVYQGSPAIMTYVYSGETSPIPGKENWEWEAELFSYPGGKPLRTMEIRCESGKPSYVVDGTKLDRKAFLLRVEEIGWLELDGEDQLHYTCDAMNLSEMIRYLEAAGGNTEAGEPLRIVAVDGGLDHTVVLYSDGTVRCAGGNDFGQCDTETWTDIVQISTMKYHTVGLRRDGTVVATGMSNSGQCDVSGWTDIVSVSAGEHHTVGVRSDGTVVFAGDSIMGEDDVAGWRNVKSVACMYTNTVGLCKDGTVYVAGSLANGKVSGWENIKAIRASDSHLLLLRADGVILTSGNNDYGQRDLKGWNSIQDLGAGSYFSVCLCKDGSILVEGIDDSGQHDARWWRDIVMVDVGEEHIIGVRKDGTLVAVGANDCGQCNLAGLNP